jgi:hypothetical protein
MPNPDNAPQTAVERLVALEERLRLQPDDLTDAELEREADTLRGLPRMFRPPASPFRSSSRPLL